jgi:hypothetical protein
MILDLMCDFERCIFDMDAKEYWDFFVFLL